MNNKPELQSPAASTEVLPQSIGVQFSGKPTVYFYIIHPDDKVTVGDRVVVPNSLKDDGSLSLTIATCVERHEVCRPEAVKPMIMSIDNVHLRWAEQEMKRLAAEAITS
jgi:hypothetical protein